MRTPIVAGNWKMHKTVRESINFVHELAPMLEPYSSVERVVCPTFLALAAVAEALHGSAVKVGAQNMHWEEKGAFTSQIAPGMLQGIAEYVILGHSEVRQYLHDSDADINKKVHAALDYHLKPILAVGESLTQRQQGMTDSHVSGQVRAGLDGVSADKMESVVIAYEPIWAIGTGMNCDPDEAERVCGQVIRGTLADLYGASVADRVRIQYGGSVKPSNMTDYMSKPNIDGGLVGGASLVVSDFVKLVELAELAKKA